MSNSSLPIFHTDSKDLGLLQTGWAQRLNPIIRNPMNDGVYLNSVSLITGTNQINHLLDRKLQGWLIIGIDSVASIHDNQANNAFPSKTLTLVSSAPCKVNLYVF